MSDWEVTVAVERQMTLAQLEVRGEVAAWNRHLSELLMKGEGWSPREIAMAMEMATRIATGVQEIAALKGATMRQEMRAHVTAFLSELT